MWGFKKHFIIVIVSSLGFSSSRCFSFAAAIGFGSPAPSFFGVVLKHHLTPILQTSVGAGYSVYSDLEIYALNPQIRFFPQGNQDVSIQFWAGGGLNVLFFGGRGALQDLDVQEDSGLPLAQLVVGVDLAAFQKVDFTLGCQFHFPIKLIFPFIEVGYRFE